MHIHFILCAATRLTAWLACSWFAVSVSAAESPIAARPNIVYILADDLGRGDVSCYNAASAWRTPCLDRLAAEGLLLSDAHSASGVCTPSRYALMTGRYSWRGPLKAQTLRGYNDSLIEPERLTVAEFLRDEGYTTSISRIRLAADRWPMGLTGSSGSARRSICLPTSGSSRTGW